MEDLHTCPKCGDNTEPGFTLDATLGNFLPTIWVEGEPERSFWTITKIRGKNKWRVVSFRCVGCGFIESYAKQEWTGKFPS